MRGVDDEEISMVDTRDRSLESNPGTPTSPSELSKCEQAVDFMNMSDEDTAIMNSHGEDINTTLESRGPYSTAVSYLYSLHLTHLMAIVLICIPFGLALLLIFTSPTSVFPLFDARAFDFDGRETRCKALTMKKSR